jgi:hypothetical protein
LDRVEFDQVRQRIGIGSAKSASVLIDWKSASESRRCQPSIDYVRLQPGTKRRMTKWE